MVIKALNKPESRLAQRVRLEKTIINYRKNDPVAFTETLRKEFKLDGDLVLSGISFLALQEITECLKTKDESSQ